MDYGALAQMLVITELLSLLSNESSGKFYFPLTTNRTGKKIYKNFSPLRLTDYSNSSKMY